MSHGMSSSMSSNSSSSASSSSSSMGMEMGTGSCKISMLWNWYTTDACFLTEGWKIRNTGDYVGTLIGLFFMTVALEGLRRLSREYDRRIRIAYYRRETLAQQALAQNTLKGEVLDPAPFRPSVHEHAIRTVMYGIQLGLAYILMLLVMGYNGGVFFAIVTGGAVGYGIFGRDTGALTVTPEQHTKGECCC